MKDGEDEAKGDDPDQGIDPRGELQNRENRRSEPRPLDQRVHRGRGAERRHRRKGDCLHRRVGPRVAGEIAEQQQEGAQRGHEGGSGLAERDSHMIGGEQRQCGQSEIGPQQHAQPSDGQAHDRGEVLDPARIEQAGHVWPEQDPEEHVFRPADIAIAVAQAIEQQVGEDVPGGEDGQRREGGLHRRPSASSW